VASVQLALRDVSIGFGDGYVLDHVSLEVQKGESVVLVGPSGRGKTVALKLFAGLLQPERGTVEFDGKSLSELSARERSDLRLKMGMLFQKNALFDSLRVGENIAFPLREKTALSESEIQDKVSFFLDAVGLAPARELFPY
jgi:phospholipid/cholesterol/gamma-HCH transport system ATP-binding protein